LSGKIWLWDLVSRRAICQLRGHTAAVYSFAFSPNSQLLVSGSFDSTLRLWDANAGSVIFVLNADARYAEVVEPVSWSPDGELVAFAVRSKVRFWNAVTHEKISAPEDLVYHTSVRFSPDGSRVQTDRGALPLPARFHSDSAKNTPANAACLLYVKDQWLTCNSKNLLWLPYEYRHCRIASQGNTMAFAATGRPVFLLSVDLEKGPLWI
jgi:WD40 repeat protein